MPAVKVIPRRTLPLLLVTIGVLFLASTKTNGHNGQASVTIPEKGSAERKSITDALRVPVQKKLKQEVVFKIDHLKVQNGWAFLLAAPQRADGGAIDYRDTPYADAYNAGAFDNSVMALFHKVGGQWRVVQYVIGATDVAYTGWDRRFHAPSAIFPH